CLPIDCRPPLAQAPERFVDRDARDPRAESRVTAKMIEPGECANVSFLDDVLGFGVIAQDAARNAEQSAIVSERNSANGGLVAFARPTYQILVAEGLGLLYQCQ